MVYAAADLIAFALAERRMRRSWYLGLRRMTSARETRLELRWRLPPRIGPIGAGRFD